VTDPEPLDWRHATPNDADLLAEMNARLIRDEGSRNPMTLPELADRMRGWLRSGEYHAILFLGGSQTVAYALYRKEAAGIHLRQLFVEPSRRRRGAGRAALEILRSSVWPPGARVRVEVLATNPEAAEFWRAVGFRDYASTLELVPTEAPSVSSR
jgi:GNAT superfamily N-acetyltransferase